MLITITICSNKKSIHHRTNIQCNDFPCVTFQRTIQQSIAVEHGCRYEELVVLREGHTEARETASSQSQNGGKLYLICNCGDSRFNRTTDGIFYPHIQHQVYETKV